MDIRQYVGARYTIKVYENSLDPSSADWEASTSYEPLVLVTYNNSSYLSKKEVPNNIGNPADNPTYWVCTGYVTGQITQLQNDIVRIDGDISDLNDELDDAERLIDKPLWGKQIAVYGDSWTDPNLSYHTWCNVLEDATGKAVHKRATGGYKFTEIATLWDYYEADIYIIMGGINDCISYWPLSDDADAIRNLIINIRNTNSKADIYLVTPCAQLNPTNSAAALYKYPFEMYRQMIWHCAWLNQVKVISGLKSTPFQMLTSADGLHPQTSADNLKRVGQWIYEGLLRGGDSRDFMNEIVKYDNNQYLIQEGAITLFVWDNGTTINSAVSAQPFPANFDSFYSNENQNATYIYSGVTYADMNAYVELISNVITFTKRTLTPTNGALSANKVTFKIYLTDCK